MNTTANVSTMRKETEREEKHTDASGPAARSVSRFNRTMGSKLETMGQKMKNGERSRASRSFRSFVARNPYSTVWGCLVVGLVVGFLLTF